MSASNSAIWRASTACRRAKACPRSASGNRDRRRPRNSPPSRRSLRSFASTMAPEMSGYLTENVPPKPQQTSLSASSTRSSPSTLEAAAGARPARSSLPQARAGIVIGDAGRDSSRRLAPPEHIDEKSGELEALAGERLGAFGVSRDRRRGARDNAASACRRRSRMARRHSRSPRSFDHLARDRLASARSPELKAGCPQQVWARGTSTRAPAVLQQFDRGKANRRPEQIDETGHEQADKRSLAVTTSVMSPCPTLHLLTREE